MALKDVKSRIASVKNIQKITRAMETVAAARLRRAEQRIEALRPYAGAIRRMTRQAAEAAGNVPNLPILNEHDSEDKIGILLVTGCRGRPPRRLVAGVPRPRGEGGLHRLHGPPLVRQRARDRVRPDRLLRRR